MRECEWTAEAVKRRTLEDTSKSGETADMTPAVRTEDAPGGRHEEAQEGGRMSDDGAHARQSGGQQRVKLRGNENVHPPASAAYRSTLQDGGGGCCSASRRRPRRKQKQRCRPELACGEQRRPLRALLVRHAYRIPRLARQRGAAAFSRSALRLRLAMFKTTVSNAHRARESGLRAKSSVGDVRQTKRSWQGRDTRKHEPRANMSPSAEARSEGAVGSGSRCRCACARKGVYGKRGGADVRRVDKDAPLAPSRECSSLRETCASASSVEECVREPLPDVLQTTCIRYAELQDAQAHCSEADR
ncbi:hypothetical protein DFH11DRAFT_1549344 [Phellopilus nigrolimitatus]|nr:hypothetical protein DFH11DRAFT_1549344 [Phellopilus nigrolimitatus]